MKKQNIFLLVGSIAVAQSAGLIGSLFTRSSIREWYILLEKPFFNPPNWIFGPVWTILYTLIGIALYLSLKHWGKNKQFLSLFAFHLFLNALWSIIFFGQRMIGLALFDIILMDISLVVMMIWSRKIDKRIAWLLLPYLLWILFATVLNGSILLLN